MPIWDGSTKRGQSSPGYVSLLLKLCRAICLIATPRTASYSCRACGWLLAKRHDPTRRIATKALAKTGPRHQAHRPPPGYSRSRCCLPQNRSMPAGQSDSELSVLADTAVDLDRAAMLLGHDVIADRKPEAGS